MACQNTYCLGWIAPKRWRITMQQSQMLVAGFVSSAPNSNRITSSLWQAKQWQTQNQSPLSEYNPAYQTLCFSNASLMHLWSSSTYSDALHTGLCMLCNSTLPPASVPPHVLPLLVCLFICRPFRIVSVNWWAVDQHQVWLHPQYKKGPWQKIEK